MTIPALAASVMLCENLFAPSLAPKMCAASPIDVDFSGSPFGPIVDTLQSGFEHLKADLLASTSIVFFAKSGCINASITGYQYSLYVEKDEFF